MLAPSTYITYDYFINVFYDISRKDFLTSLASKASTGKGYRWVGVRALNVSSKLKINFLTSLAYKFPPLSKQRPVLERLLITSLGIRS